MHILLLDNYDSFTYNLAQLLTESNMCTFEIIKNASHYLKKNGRIYLEIGYDQAQAVSRLLEEHRFTDIVVAKDLAGHHRVVYGEIKE